MSNLPTWEKVVIGVGLVIALLAILVFLGIRRSYAP